MWTTTLRTLGWMLATILFVAIAVPPAAAQTIRYTGSVQYSSGEYIFSERTHSVYLSNGLSVSGDRVDVSVSLPVIFQSSPWVSYSLVGSIPSGGTQQGAVGGRRGKNGQGDGQGAASKAGGGRDPGGDGQGPGGDGTHDPSEGRQPGETLVLPDTTSYTSVGIGDPSARLDAQVLRDGPSWLGVGLSASVKVPVADVDRGFGTGAWDGGLGLSLSKRVGSWFLFGDATYWWLGDMTDVALNNSVAYSASVGRSLAGGSFGLLASLSGYTREIVDNVNPPLQLGVGANYNLSQGKYGLNGSLTLGLSESTPDLSFGAGWSVRF